MTNNVFAVIDTNVLVSALITSNPESPPLAVLTNVYAGTIIPVFNDEILEEYRNVLSREKFHLDQFDIEEALEVFIQYGLNIERTEVKDEAYLVTGNIKHFPKKPFVVTPREMLDILNQDQ